jgi:hypothetical protein
MISRGHILSVSSIALFLVAPGDAAEKDALKTKDAKVVWGKEVNGLAVSLAPAKEGGLRFLIRWKNVGKEPLELPWVRFKSDRVYAHLDDLLNHVYMKKPDGSLVPARKYRFPIIGGPPYRPRTVILEPGKVHQETIDLATYLELPREGGGYPLSIGLEIKGGYAPSRAGARYWTGIIQSNVVDLPLGSAKAKDD